MGYDDIDDFCRICQKGYILDNNKKCVKIEDERCVGNLFYWNNERLINQEDFYLK